MSTSPEGSPEEPPRSGWRKPKAPEPRRNWGMVFWLALILLGLLLLNLSEDSPFNSKEEPTLKKLREDLGEGKPLPSFHVKEVVYDGHYLWWQLGDGAPQGRRENHAVASEIPDDLRKLIDERTEKGLREKRPSQWQIFLLTYAPWIFLLVVFYFIFFRQFRSSAGGNIFNFGKSRATLVRPESINKTFKDVAGVDEAKEELSEIVKFLKNPEKFTKLGGRLPRGVLLNGPPGTGKTLLAKAIAGEAGVPFYSISGSDFVEMFVGVGASRVRDLFKQAKENSPSIIFLDEIDAVGRRRGSGLGGGHDEREQTLNAILVEMDGFDSDGGVIVVASTNRVDVLDPALLRPGRFDRHVSVGLPDIEGRKAILAVHSKKIKLSTDVEMDLIAQGTTGFSGADLENLLNEAALIAVDQNNNSVTMDNLYQARDKTAYGKARTSKVVHEEDLKVTAYHEAGHAVISLNTTTTMKLEKITIIPIGNAAGANFYRPERDDEHIAKRKLLGEIMRCYGGRVAEVLFFEDITAGASGDIQQATKIARRMVTQWGMSGATGLVNYEASEERMFLGGEITRSKTYSEATAKQLDDEIRRILDECYEKSYEIISSNKDALVRIAEALLVYESLTGIEVQQLFDNQELKRKPPVHRVITRVAANGTRYKGGVEVKDDDSVVDGADKDTDVAVAKDDRATTPPKGGDSARTIDTAV